MRVKVCGMREPENIEDLVDLPIDYIGLIFYEKSKRFVSSNFSELDFKNKTKVGVFVNASADFIEEKSKLFDFKTIQLHGDESPLFCKRMKSENFEIIKAFSVDDEFDFAFTESFERYCDYFLFDTKGKLPGGNGFKFNWEILENYQGETPFFLSGGINETHVELVKSLNFNKLHAIDLNSGFEIQPAQKNISLLKKFIQDVRS